MKQVDRFFIPVIIREDSHMDIKVNFSGRAIRYTEEEIAVVVEAMRNADPLTQGRYMREFESKF